MCPSIVLDANNNVVLVIGAAGGSRITTSTAYVSSLNHRKVFNLIFIYSILKLQSTIRHLWLQDNLYNSFAAKRIHHQLLPMYVHYEYGFNPTILDGLEAKGHKVVQMQITRGFSAVTGISKLYDILDASPDPRRNGSVAIL